MQHREIETATAALRSQDIWSWGALTVGVLALGGSLWLSIGLELKACPLCLYQRTFVMGAVSVLAMGRLAGGGRTSLAALLALPAATGGWGVALFHLFLESTGALECPAGLLGWGTAPQQSAAVLSALVILLAIGACRTSPEGRSRGGAALGALLLGGALGAAAIQSAPPMPEPPAQPYDVPLDICRPPFQGSTP